MDFLGIFFLACALSMDAFAVAVCKGFAITKPRITHYLIIGAYFGAFQALMPALGFVVGSELVAFIGEIDHWIAFILLSFVGAKMIKEGASAQECPKDSANFDTKTMLLLAIATSLDALIVGVSFAFLRINVLLAVSIIGVVAFVISAAGLHIGIKFGAESRLGARFAAKAELIGGAVLIAIGAKILIQHLFF